MDDIRFFICNHCGNIITKLRDSGVSVVCCGEQMAELIPNTTDAAQEKHVPIPTIAGDTIEVKVGAVAHPMEPDHYIQWICLLTDRGSQFAFLEPGDAPEATFGLAGAKAIACFSYCNKHGLWKAAV